jgi:soluble lytic murein transglycosylase-like protein
MAIIDHLMASMLLFLLGSWSVAADVYVYKDASGVAHYTNAPEHDRYERIVAVLQVQGASNQAGATPDLSGVARYADVIEEVAADVGIEKALVHAVITAESSYNAKAVSRSGAQGLMQLMPATARRYGVADSFDPAQNIRGGTRYLRDLMSLFDNDLKLALAAYNAGENAVLKHGRQVPPYRETQAYVPKVLSLYGRYLASL